MSRILKWNVPVDDKPHEIGGGPVSHVACQYGPETVQVWTLEPDEATGRTVRQIRVQVFGTGHPVPEAAWPLGSVIVADGALVWHVVPLLPEPVAS